jgi:hypothetical protein
LNLRQDFLGHRNAVAEKTVGAEIEVPQVERQPRSIAVQLEELSCLAYDFYADAVTGQNGDLLPRGHGLCV